MNQIAHRKYWPVVEAPTICTNRGFHEYHTGVIFVENRGLFVQTVGASKTALHWLPPK